MARRGLRPALFCACALLLFGCGEQGAPPEPAQSAEPELLLVAERGDVSALDALLGAEADVNVRNSCDWTPLMKAALYGHPEAVEKLLAAGAEIDAVDQGGYTAMMLAASNNHARVVDLLLEHGAMVDAQERTQGFTALIWAAQLGHRESVEVLLRHGADATLPDFEGRSAMERAAAEGHAAVASLLSARSPPGDASTGG